MQQHAEDPTHLEDKLLVYVLFGNAGLEFLTLQETDEELVYQLERVERTERKTQGLHFSVGERGRGHCSITLI